MEYAPGYHDCSYDHVQALSALLVPMPTDPLAVVVCPVYGLLGQMFSSKYACGLPWLCQPIITRLNSVSGRESGAGVGKFSPQRASSFSPCAYTMAALPPNNNVGQVTVVLGSQWGDEGKGAFDNELDF